VHSVTDQGELQRRAAELSNQITAEITGSGRDLTLAALERVFGSLVDAHAAADSGPRGPYQSGPALAADWRCV
jgi:hypothetical protein